MLTHKSQIKRLSLILCIFMIINFLFAISVSADNEQIEKTAVVDIKDYSNNKNESQYKISDAKGLAVLSDLVNSGIKFSGKTIYLVNDIEFDNKVVNNFKPIGVYDTVAFEGTFDGQGYVIRGINIDRPNESYQAIFSHTTSSTIIKNLGVTDSSISGSTSVAAIAATNFGGTIENCYNNSTLKCKNILGGIVGNNTGKIVNCINYSPISGDALLLGGICGKNDGDIKICSNLGKLIAASRASDIGGICAENSFKIYNCYNTGDIVGNSKCNVGGICGSTYIDLNTSNISNTFNVGTIVGGKNTGAIVGISRNFNGSTRIANNYYLIGSAEKGVGRDDPGKAKVMSETSEKMKTQEFVDILNSATLTSGKVWTRNNNINDGYPIFISDNNTMYKLNIINDSADGTISFEGKTEETIYVEAGSKVNLEVTPNEYFSLSDLIINDVSTNNTTGEFIMPSKDSKVSPIFAEGSADNDTSKPEGEMVEQDKNNNIGSDIEGTPDDVEGAPNNVEMAPDIIEGSNANNVPDNIENSNENTEMDNKLDENKVEESKVDGENVSNDKEDTVIDKVFNNIFNTGDNKKIFYLLGVMMVSFIIIIVMVMNKKR